MTGGVSGSAPATARRLVAEGGRVVDAVPADRLFALPTPDVDRMIEERPDAVRAARP